VTAVARRLGIAPATVRNWARRYDLGPSGHAAGSHRRYSEQDLARLEAMRRLTLQGVSPAQAAQVVHATPVSALPAPHPGQGSSGPTAGTGSPGLALPAAETVVRGLGRAAAALDAATVTSGIRRCVQEYGVLRAWDDVLRPVLVAAGARWAATGEGVEVEHLLADCATAVLREVAGRAEQVPASRPVLLAGAPGELHALPLHALAAALAERGVPARTLGPALPATALQAAVRRTGPAVLFVWSHLAQTADPQVLADLPVTRPRTAVLVGGCGWDAARLPARVALAHDLAQAVSLVERAVRG
jgi:DNA-binding transcriptional MerR regulator